MLGRLRKELCADINTDLSDAIREQLAAQVEPLAKRIADVKDLNVGLSRAVRDLKRPRDPQPSSVRSLLVQAAACHLLGTAHKRPAVEVAARRYGGSPRVLDAIANPGAVIARAAVPPATATSVGWAGARPAHPACGQRIGEIPIPTPPSDLAGVFVAEGEPAPVKSMSLAAATLTPRKIALISHFSAEIFEQSLPTIEAIVRQGIADDTGGAVDKILLDGQPADAVRPAGLLAGVTPLPPTSGPGIEALAGDIRQLVDAVSASGPVIDPVLITDTGSEIAIRLLMQIPALPVIGSAVLAPKTAVLVDAADFASGEGGDLAFDSSREAVLHSESEPLPVSAAGTIAAPVGSLWQTDLIGIRMRQSLAWTLRRPGRVAVVENVGW